MGKRKERCRAAMRSSTAESSSISSTIRVYYLSTELNCSKTVALSIIGSQEDGNLMNLKPQQWEPTAAVALHILLASVTVPSVYFIITQNLNTLFDLVNHPAQTLRVLTILHAPVVIGSYSSLRRDPQHCSFWKAAARGLMGLPIGALLNAFGAIVLGAPVGFKYLMQTVYWSLLMSLFTFVPPSCAFGLSRMDWQHLLAHSKPTEMTEYLISLPAHGAIVGAWLGAWLMPLDWDMPWQGWPICVTFGAIGGYFVGLLASLVCILLQKPIRAKAD